MSEEANKKDDVLQEETADEALMDWVPVKIKI